MMLGRRAFEPGNDFQSKVPAVRTSQMRRRRRFASVVLAEDQRQGEQGLDEEKTFSGSRMGVFAYPASTSSASRTVRRPFS
jgi:hypothetical protein